MDLPCGSQPCGWKIPELNGAVGFFFPIYVYISLYIMYVICPYYLL